MAACRASWGWPPHSWIHDHHPLCWRVRTATRGCARAGAGVGYRASEVKQGGVEPSRVGQDGGSERRAGARRVGETSVRPSTSE